MGCFVKCLGITSVLVSLVVGFVVYKVCQPPPLPDIRLAYWGPGEEKPDDKTIRPFKIHATPAELKTLKEKLELTSPLVPSLENAGFHYGINTEYLNEILQYWKTKYNWREREAFLNKYPHFKTQIGGLDIHFMHVKPDPSKVKGKKVLPLLLVHGWPGSIREFYEIIPLLTSPRPNSDFVFEVISPSLPGYAFSQAASKTGLCPPHIAVIFGELMTRLGFEKFYYQAGDWGSMIGYIMSVLYPDRVLGFHSNFCYATTSEARLRLLFSLLFPSLVVDKAQQKIFWEQLNILIFETGYLHIQATKPDTIGVGMTDSPAGLAAYLLEKFETGTNREMRHLTDGGLGKFNKDDLLDNIMLYWLNRSITTSMRLYKEVFNQTDQCFSPPRQPITKVPTACARFPHEVVFHPNFVLEAQFKNLISITDLPKGGHFAALEEPNLLADNFWEFVETVQKISKAKKNEL